MAEPDLRLLRIEPATEEQRRTGVPEGVKPGPGTPARRAAGLRTRLIRFELGGIADARKLGCLT
jgi:hypothetical protein